MYQILVHETTSVLDLPQLDFFNGAEGAITSKDVWEANEQAALSTSRTDRKNIKSSYQVPLWVESLTVNDITYRSDYCPTNQTALVYLT